MSTDHATNALAWPAAADTAAAHPALLAEERPVERLALAFAAQALGWARAQGASLHSQQAVQVAAAAVSRAISEGHVCVLLADLVTADVGTADVVTAESADPALATALLGSGVVGRPVPFGRPQPPFPLLLDGDGRLYLQRYFAHEQALAARLLQALQLPPQPLTPTLQALLQRLFQPNEAGLNGAVDGQKQAAEVALRRRLTLISGGPGTGKTTTVVNLLACLLAQDPACRIALAAPTGKAAARMTEAIRQRATHLPAELQVLLPGEASTVHRLLGVLPAAGADGERFAHHAGRPLALDVLVVDEASMLDLALARRLLDAVPPAARIVLLGDKDQLSAVEAGAVFAELSARPGLGAAAPDDPAHAEAATAAALATPGPETLDRHVVWFSRNFRFAADSGIGRLAADIQAGQAAPVLAWLRQGQDTSVRWLDDAAGPAATDAALFDSLHQGLANYLAALQQQPADLAAVTRAFNRFRVLCALREGPRGVQAVNQRLSLHARAALGLGTGEAGSPWFSGRPVMVLRNDPLLRLFNGDVGITLLDAAGVAWVHFPSAEGGFRAVPALRLPTHQTAFAMTVHKSQGSEFDAVLVLLPAQRSPVLTRELLYTAVTRAREHVTLVGSAQVLTAAVSAPTQRRSGLLARLKELQELQELQEQGP